MIMTNHFSRWKRLFLFCFGVFIGSAFAMKWMEGDLIYNGEQISILRLELFEPKERIMSIFSGVDNSVKTILRYHLSFDFIFMAGCFPGIACMAVMAAEKTNRKWLRKLLLVAAFVGNDCFARIAACDKRNVFLHSFSNISAQRNKKLGKLR